MVKDNLHQFGIDFDQTFAAMVKLMAFRVFFKLDIDQIFVKTVFLYDFIDQLLYVRMLKGTKTNANRDIIYKLLKVLYSFKKSLCFYYKKFTDLFF